MPCFRGGFSGRQGSAPLNPLYFSTLEALFADSVLAFDFSPGYWYLVDADHTTWKVTPPGWGGNLSSGNPPTPAGAVRNLTSIAKKPLFTGSDYVGTTGILDGIVNQRNNAWHNLFGAGVGDGLNEIYNRRYVYYVEANYYGAGNPASDSDFGAQKFVTYNNFDDDGGINVAGEGINIGSGSVLSTGAIAIVDNHGSVSVWGQNQGVNISCSAGSWYFVESHLKLNTSGNADGVYELWINNGGPTGDFTSQSPVLRARHTNVPWGYLTGQKKIGSLWFENWSNPVQSGEQFWANIHARTAAPVGFVR